MLLHLGKNWKKETTDLTCGRTVFEMQYPLVTGVATGWWCTPRSYASSDNSLIAIAAKCVFTETYSPWLYHCFAAFISTDCSLLKLKLYFFNCWLMLIGILAASLISSSGTGGSIWPPRWLKSGSLGAEHSAQEQLRAGWPPSRSTRSVPFPMPPPDLGNGRATWMRGCGRRGRAGERQERLYF